MKKRVMADGQTGICPRNRHRMRAMIEPHNRALLLHLPDELVRQAGKTTKRDVKLRLLTSAIALEILFVCPLRISNLLGIRLDQHLRRAVGPKRIITHIILEPSEVKNNVAIEWPIPKGTADRLEVWLKARQALGDDSGGGWLFPGEKGQHRCISSMRTILSNEIGRIVGIEVNPHLLRHFAAWLFLKHNPGQYEPVRRILGHRSITTTMMAYTGLEADTAARRLDDVVIRERQVTRMIATGVFAKRARKTRVHKKDAAAQTTGTEAKRPRKKPTGQGGQ
jgi:integrase